MDREINPPTADILNYAHSIYCLNNLENYETLIILPSARTTIYSTDSAGQFQTALSSIVRYEHDSQKGGEKIKVPSLQGSYADQSAEPYRSQPESAFGLVSGGG